MPVSSATYSGVQTSVSETVPPEAAREAPREDLPETVEAEAPAAPAKPARRRKGS